MFPNKNLEMLIGVLKTLIQVSGRDRVLQGLSSIEELMAMSEGGGSAGSDLGVCPGPTQPLQSEDMTGLSSEGMSPAWAAMVRYQ